MPILVSKIEYILDMYFAAAAVDFKDHFVHQHTNQSSVILLSSLIHKLPKSSSSILETAFGFNADSTIDSILSPKYIFFGESLFKHGNNIQR
jgi:hypothetical protein